MNKRKIINDPVYGFISIPSDLVFDLISHPYFQRLRRIKQLGLTELVYPGANHTRFHHALGAMHLMKNTLDTLKAKGHYIYDTEYEAALIAILLHDIGHGPFSHTLESALVKNIRHEDLSSLVIRELNKHFKGHLDFAIQVFQDRYPRKFLHQLVSSQLDADRLDYLKRDSFFTGVYEGAIGADRIIKMMNIIDDRLVVEEKGIYSIENFLSARRLMYWQVYLHKTTVCAEKMMIKCIERAKVLVRNNELECPSTDLEYFLQTDYHLKDFQKDHSLIRKYCNLDDTDIWSALKIWSRSEDVVLSRISKGLVERQLFQIVLLNEQPETQKMNDLKSKVQQILGVDDNDLKYLVASGKVSNAAYIPQGQINIMTKSGAVVDVAEATDLPNIQAMKKIVVKHYVCWPKEVTFGF